MKKIKSILNKVVKCTQWYHRVFKDCNKFWNIDKFGYEFMYVGGSFAEKAFPINYIKSKHILDLTTSATGFVVWKSIIENYYSYLGEDSPTVILSFSPVELLTGSDCYFDDRLYTILNIGSIPSFSNEKFNYIRDIKNNPVKYIPLYEICNRGHKEINTDTTLTDYLCHKYAFCEYDNKRLKLIHRDAIDDSFEIIYQINQFCKDRSIRFVVLVYDNIQDERLLNKYILDSDLVKEKMHDMTEAGIECIQDVNQLF